MPSVTLYPSKDAYIDEGSPSSNYGSGTLTLGSINNYRKWVYFYVDVSSIPKGYTITSAQLNGHYSGLYTESGYSMMNVTAYPLAASWSETGITWNNKPGYSTAASSVSTLSDNDYTDPGSPGQSYMTDLVNIPEVIDYLVNSGTTNYGIVLTVPQRAPGYTQSWEDHSDGLIPFSISVNYSKPPTAPTGLSPANNQKTTLTPTLSWTHNDPDGDSQQKADLEIYNSSGSLVYSTTNYSSSQSFNVPSGYLSRAQTYHFRVKTHDSYGLASPWSAYAYFITNQLPSMTITDPSGSSASPTVFFDSQTPTIGWSFSDPDGQTQKSVQIQILNESAAVVWDSGEIVTTAATYQIPSSAGLSYDKLYHVKIRGKDSLGEWGSYSSAVYFWLDRQPSATPTSPTGSSPTSPEIVNNNLDPAMTWTFSDPDATDSQGSYQIEIYNSGNTLIRDTGDVASQATSYQAGSGLFAYGQTYHWRIRVKDSHGSWSSWSNYQYFYMNRDPLKPTTDKNGTQAAPYVFNNDVTPTLSWTFNDDPGDTQASYEFILMNDVGTVLYDSGEIVSSNKSHSIPYAYKLSYGSAYQYQVRTKDNYGQWSPYSDIQWIESVVGAPTGLMATADNFTASIGLDWDDVLAEGLQGYNVYRRTDPAGTWTKINTSIVTSSSYTDASVVSGTLYYYSVESYVSSTQISDKSSSVSASVTFSAWFIGAFKFEGAKAFPRKRKRSQSVKETLRGRSIQDKGFKKYEFTLELDLLDDQYSTGEQKFNDLMTELEKTTVLSVKDPFGHQWDCNVGDVDVDPIIGTGAPAYNVKINLSEA